MATRVFGSLTLTLLLGATPFGQAPPQSLDAIFKEFTGDQSPGCAVGATRGDAPLAAKGYGMADLEHGVRLTPHSVFYMASVSKQFAALSILLLERDGKLQLDDRVKTHIPELPAYADAITIRQLLHHTSGLRDYLTLSALAGHSSDYVITDRGVLKMLARQAQLNFAPGTDHLYSNSGYVLLSLIVQRVTGRPLDDVARERIFTPLNMRSTRFQHDHTAPIPTVRSATSGATTRGGSRTACLMWSATAACIRRWTICCDGPPHSSGRSSRPCCRAWQRPAPSKAAVRSPAATGWAWCRAPIAACRSWGMAVRSRATGP